MPGETAGAAQSALRNSPGSSAPFVKASGRPRAARESELYGGLAEALSQTLRKEHLRKENQGESLRGGNAEEVGPASAGRSSDVGSPADIDVVPRQEVYEWIVTGTSSRERVSASFDMRAAPSGANMGEVAPALPCDPWHVKPRLVSSVSLVRAARSGPGPRGQERDERPALLDIRASSLFGARFRGLQGESHGGGDR